MVVDCEARSMLSGGRGHAVVGRRMPTGPLARNVVYRRQVSDRLDQSRDVPIVLISAPAGYGKSLAVASWLADRDIPDVAWVNVTPARGPRRSLWAELVDGLTHIAADDDEVGELRGLAQRASGDVTARLESWILARPREVVLVLDDLHERRDAETHEQLVEFIVGASANLHVVVMSRHDPPWPLHQLRLEGLLTDIRTETIRFDNAEAADLAGSLGVELTAENADVLVSRTQGWAAGLRLAVLGMQQAANPQEYVAALSGRTGYIADYLMKEVFDGLSREWQDFLTRVSIVDEVCPELAMALGGGSDSAEILAELAGMNAFIYELGHQCRRYRLHPLLLDFLRSRISDHAQQVRLHRLAADWYCAQGEPMTALGHALDAGDWSSAGDLVGTHIVTWAVCQSPAELAGLLDAVPREAVLTHPGLAIGAAAIRGMSGRADGVAELMAGARAQLFRVAGRRRGYELLFGLIDAGDRRWTGDLNAMRQEFERLPRDPGTLSVLGLADWPALQALILANLGVSELWLLDSGRAREYLEAAAAIDMDHRIILPVINARAHLAYLYWECGELSAAAELAHRTVEHLEQVGLGAVVQAAAAYLALAGVALDRDDIDAAQSWLMRAAEANREPHTSFAVSLMWARLALARGDAIAAASGAQQLTAADDAVHVPDGLQRRAACFYESVVKTSGEQRFPVEYEGSIRARLQAHLTVATSDVAEHEERLEALESALGLAAAQHLRRPFLDAAAVLRPLLTDRIEKGSAHAEFVADLMVRTAAAISSGSDRQHGFFDSLTAREVDVLTYLAGSLTTAEIADELFISVNTVKTHQRSVYQKLGANSRRGAVTTARELGLI